MEPSPSAYHDYGYVCKLKKALYYMVSNKCLVFGLRNSLL